MIFTAKNQASHAVLSLSCVYKVTWIEVIVIASFTSPLTLVYWTMYYWYVVAWNGYPSRRPISIDRIMMWWLWYGKSYIAAIRKVSKYLQDSAVPFPLHGIGTSSECRFQFFIITAPAHHRRYNIHNDGQEVAGTTIISPVNSYRIIPATTYQQWCSKRL